MIPAFALALALLAQSPPAPPTSTAQAAPLEFESFQLVLLRRPEHPTDYPESKLAEIQQAHLAHLRQMAEAGKLLVAGPFGDQPDPRLRGLELFRVSGIEEARRLAEDDPAVKAGRLEVVIMTWYTEKGALAFPIADRLRKN